MGGGLTQSPAITADPLKRPARKLWESECDGFTSSIQPSKVVVWRSALSKNCLSQANTLEWLENRRTKIQALIPLKSHSDHPSSQHSQWSFSSDDAVFSQNKRKPVLNSFQDIVSAELQGFIRNSSGWDFWCGASPPHM